MCHVDVRAPAAYPLPVFAISHRDDRTWETKLGIFGGDGNSPREDCHLVGHVPSWASRTPLRKTRIHSRPLSDAAEHAGVGRVVYRSPILVETLFAPPTARRTPQGVEHSDQIFGNAAHAPGPRRAPAG